MTSRGPADVLVLEATAEGQGLDARLGPRLAVELQAELHERAAAFGDRVAQGRVHTAAPGARLSEAVSRMYEENPDQADEAPQSRPLFVIWPELVLLGDRHAAGALEDLRSGADVVFGPVIDGGLYLLGLRQSFPDLLTRLDEAAQSIDLGMLGLAAASELGLEIGLLRVERALRTPSDMEAALADPLTPENVRRVLSGSA
jgi:hypothetical protein